MVGFHVRIIRGHHHHRRGGAIVAHRRFTPADRYVVPPLPSTGLDWDWTGGEGEGGPGSGPWGTKEEASKEGGGGWVSHPTTGNEGNSGTEQNDMHPPLPLSQPQPQPQPQHRLGARLGGGTDADQTLPLKQHRRGQR